MPDAPRVIPDVNVILSGATSPRGPARDLLLAAKRFDVVFVLGEEHFVELRRVLTYQNVLSLGGGLTAAEAFGLAYDLLQVAEVVQRVQSFDWPSCPDPKDWYLLNLLMTSEAEALVTKDKHLLRMHDKLGLPVYEPKELVRLGVI
ncbi:putative toxin-antitoxin system toxin component, PIN family [Deinococcus planocerae]|uniref:putative toxin-antitoxin system toxin component, PIN family n=1 Tax=Deinococcus planocerae TaxID=1737569 RepID=UPI000C7E91BF|nr:putative toxin-antitoxin system toxin component, PIN family [Deinococcus planocerae]